MDSNSHFFQMDNFKKYFETSSIRISLVFVDGGSEEREAWSQPRQLVFLYLHLSMDIDLVFTLTKRLQYQNGCMFTIREVIRTERKITWQIMTSTIFKICKNINPDWARTRTNGHSYTKMRIFLFLFEKWSLILLVVFNWHN